MTAFPSVRALPGFNTMMSPTLNDGNHLYFRITISDSPLFNVGFIDSPSTTTVPNKRHAIVANKRRRTISK